jgi:hypothetical protein
VGTSALACLSEAEGAFRRPRFIGRCGRSAPVARSPTWAFSLKSVIYNTSPRAWNYLVERLADHINDFELSMSAIAMFRQLCLWASTSGCFTALGST